jgi:hypothetical protein
VAMVPDSDSSIPAQTVRRLMYCIDVPPFQCRSYHSFVAPEIRFDCIWRIETTPIEGAHGTKTWKRIFEGQFFK